ncbi:MAG: VOC family protein [Sphingomonadales bacterium]|nr:VOC family protein [Sphingomonadales bacterium]
MRLRSIELALPGAGEAARFLADVWGCADAGQRGARHYLRGSGDLPYLVRLTESRENAVESVTFTCARARLAGLARAVAAHGLKARPVTSDDPGGGEGILVELPEGEVLRFLAGSASVAPIAPHPRASRRVMPVKLTHVVLNAIDAEASARVVEEVLGFAVSDRTRAMVFLRCNRAHHSTAFARAGFASLNHIAFEMDDLDAVMRGIGHMRDHGFAPAWGPGRHGPGANVYAYYIAPFGAVIEYSTAVERVAADHRAGTPEDWNWPDKRIDQWGLSDKDTTALRAAEEKFRFHRNWAPAPLSRSARG